MTRLRQPSVTAVSLTGAWLALMLLGPEARAATGAAPAARSSAEDGYHELGAGIIGASEVRATGRTDSKLTFASSDAPLVKGFVWAKRQAMAFAFDDDPVGAWYEAAEPGREAFCMRDTAHQAMGAHALGLMRHNRNMLRRFAEAISDARDWCSLWEIDRFGRPAPVDYKNDAEFWYNLPANFDVLDCCHRMYLWSGDPAYVTDPVFLSFYDRTVTDYVERWGLSLDQVMTRPRLLNVRGIPVAGKKFQVNRGIPGYDEGTPGYVLGVDVLATQYVAYLGYARIQAVRGNAEVAQAFVKKAADVRTLVNTSFWNESGGHFFGRLGADHKPEGRAGSGLLYRDVVDDGPRLESALREGRGSVEVLYRYGDPDAATERMIDIAQGKNSRREYPEVPYSWLGALVNGTMGITLEGASALQAQVEGFWIEATVRTQSGLGTKIAWAEIANLPIRASLVTVRHDGTRKTALTNQQGPALIWQASFDGSHETLLVNGRPVKARHETRTLGRETSWVRITVGGGGTVTVEVPPAAASNRR